MYDVLQVSAVRDHRPIGAAWARLGASLAGTSGRLLGDAEDPTPVAGVMSARLAIVVFDDVAAARGWQASAALRGILADLSAAAVVTLRSAGGVGELARRRSALPHLDRQAGRKRRHRARRHRRAHRRAPATVGRRRTRLLLGPILDTPPSESFDRISRMAGQLFGLPIAAVSLTDTDRQWFKSRMGVEYRSIPREKAPCAQVAESRDLLVIEDLLDDLHYCDSVLARAGVRFYAGAPLITRDGYGLGAMCVLGTVPRVMTPAERRTLHDLAAMVMSQIELQHAFGRMDPISELPNRIQFADDLADLGCDQAAERQQVAVLVDLIAADELNHTMRVMGPGVIDDMVKASARAFRAMLGPQRTAYHVGTTQFIALAPEGMEVDAYVDLLRSSSEQIRRLGGSDAIGTTVLGVAPFMLGEAPASDLLRALQGAAQDARLAGRTLHVYSAQTDRAFQRSFTLLHDFEAALRAPSDLRLVYQPRVDLASGGCVGAEALIRWAHPTLGPIAPSEFIPLIERMALATPTTAWVLETAVAQVARWRDAGFDLTLSVNISAANLREPDFVGKVKAVLARHAVRPSSLELELTETAVMSDAELALAQLEDLAGAGIGLAIDDFGTGYSSLAYLQRLPVHAVKIDRSFVGDLDTDPHRLTLVTMMIAMAKHLGRRVVAEGIETQAVLDRLRATDCDEVQGYFLARPMPADSFEAWYCDRSHAH